MTPSRALQELQRAVLRIEDKDRPLDANALLLLLRQAIESCMQDEWEEYMGDGL